MNPPPQLDDGKHTISVSNLKSYSSVLYITEHNKIFTIPIHAPGFWHNLDTIRKLVIIFEQIKSNQVNLHVEGVKI